MYCFLLSIIKGTMTNDLHLPDGLRLFDESSIYDSRNHRFSLLLLALINRLAVHAVKLRDGLVSSLTGRERYH